VSAPPPYQQQRKSLRERIFGPIIVAGALLLKFGKAALLLATIGLYGVMSYSISRRTSEIGIRMALGASQSGVIWMVLREVLWMVAIGVAIGLLGALASGRLIGSRLFGLTPADPATLVLAISVILLAAALAGFVPARRASRIDPMNALRSE